MIPFAKPLIGQEEIEAVKRVLESGMLAEGKVSRDFEKMYAEYTGTKFATVTNNGTTALSTALEALNIQPGDEVITSPFTFIASANSIAMVGAIPVFVDVKPDTYNIDPDLIEEAITDKTRAIMPVHIFGMPSDMKHIMDISDSHGLLVIEDACQAHGAEIDGKKVGAFGHVASFSFYATKNLTCGEGGMVLSRHRPFSDLVRILSRHGLTSTAHERSGSGEWKYEAVRAGCKASLSELHAAVGLGQLSDYKRQQKQRERLAERYVKNLSDLREYLEPPVVRKHCRHGWHLFIIRLHLSALKIDRDRFIRLMARRGIECGVHYQPIFELSFYRNHLGLSPQFFPNATYAGRRVVSLPFYPTLKPGEVDRVCESIRSIVIRHHR